MKGFLLILLLTVTLTAYTTQEAQTQGTQEQEFCPVTEEGVQKMWKTAVLTERQEDVNWVREWRSTDGRQLAIEYIEISHYLADKEYYDTRKPLF